MIKLFYFLFVFMCFALPVMAGVTCRDDTIGYTRCKGYNKNAKHIDIKSKVDSSGVKETTGTIAGQIVKLETRTDSRGIETTTGEIGKHEVLLHSKQQSSGYKKTVGQIDHRQINLETKKDRLGHLDLKKGRK